MDAGFARILSAETALLETFAGFADNAFLFAHAPVVSRAHDATQQVLELIFAGIGRLLEP